MTQFTGHSVVYVYKDLVLFLTQALGSNELLELTMVSASNQWSLRNHNMYKKTKHVTITGIKKGNHNMYLKKVILTGIKIM